jgi:hypothetical protein
MFRPPVGRYSAFIREDDHHASRICAIPPYLGLYVRCRLRPGGGRPAPARGIALPPAMPSSRNPVLRDSGQRSRRATRNPGVFRSGQRGVAEPTGTRGSSALDGGAAEPTEAPGSSARVSTRPPEPRANRNPGEPEPGRTGTRANRNPGQSEPQGSSAWVAGLQSEPNPGLCRSRRRGGGQLKACSGGRVSDRLFASREGGFRGAI